MIKLVAFDLDGTLLDTAQDFFLAVNTLRERYGIEKADFNEVRSRVSEGAISLASYAMGIDNKKVSKEELIAIKQKLKVPDNEIDQVGKIFNKATEDSLGYEPYAKQIAQIYQNKPAVLDEVINILFYIAEADGKVSNSELAMIKNIAQIFNLTDIQFEGIKESRKGSDKLNPYIVLGCTSNDDFATIRKKYLQLSKEHHPDALISKGVPKEVIEESKKKMRAINSAFDKIEKMQA